MFRELEKSFPSDECFLDGKKSKTSRRLLAGHHNLRFVHRIGPMEKKRVSIKSIIFLSIKNKKQLSSIEGQILYQILLSEVEEH